MGIGRWWVRLGLSVLESMMLVHRSRIARLDVPARAIFSQPAVFKREALATLLLLTPKYFKSHLNFWLCYRSPDVSAMFVVYSNTNH